MSARRVVVDVSAKARMLSTVDEIRASIDRLPEPACVLLEQSNLLGHLRGHLGTFGNVSAAAATLAPFAGDVARRVASLGKLLRRR